MVGWSLEWMNECLRDSMVVLWMEGCLRMVALMYGDLDVWNLSDGWINRCLDEWIDV